ncbi:MAG TPA: TonB family protein [Terriglobales bacterium]|nr:TonB family protein [Terriglobales bacterium]
MSELWKQWTGRDVAGKFTLESYLGGSDHSAVFLTTRSSGAGSGKAAIKLISADLFSADRGAEKQLARWNSIREWNHPNLIRIFEAGRCDLDGTQLLYVVEEYAEENLAQILPERALTAEETRGMLPPVLQALQFVHDKGFVHGSIQPANILAIGDDVKLSTDSLQVAGEKEGVASAPRAIDPPEATTGVASTAGDVWQLGTTLVAVLTQRLPDWDRTSVKTPEVPVGVPEPFREIATNCLQIDPGKRWTVGQISNRLELGRTVPPVVQAKAPEAKVAASKTAQPSSAQPKTAQASSPSGSPIPKSSAKWPYAVLAAAVVIALIAFAARHKTSSPSDNQSSQASSGTTAQTAPVSPEPGDHTSSVSATSPSDSQNGVVRRVLPEVSDHARRTIHGTIKVRVRVTVDPAGNVEVSKIESGRASHYFDRLALEAANDWKFTPAPAGESDVRKWILEFSFKRAKIDASATRATH